MIGLISLAAAIRVKNSLESRGGFSGRPRSRRSYVSAELIGDGVF